jgi:hypothetical protein
MASTRLNKNHLRELIRSYERLSVQKEKVRAEYEGSRSSEQAFRDYLALWDFGVRVPSNDGSLRQEKMEVLLETRRKLEKFEAWRRQRAKKS